MADPALLEGVTAEIVNTPPLETHLLTGGVEGGAPVFFVHGNTSSSRFFEETLAALPPEPATGVSLPTSEDLAAPRRRRWMPPEASRISPTIYTPW